MKHDFETAIRLPSAPLLLGVMRDPRIVAIEDAQRDEFDAIEKMAINTVKGLEGSYSLFVTGGAGMGKSFTVTKVLNDLEPEGDGHIWKAISAKISTVNVYKALYDFREKGQCLILDDADGFLADTDALNVIKAATDTKPVRRVSWMTNASHLSEKGSEVPRQFDYEGSLIVISNKNFADLATGRSGLAEHFEAIVDRGNVVNVNIETQEERVIRIRAVARTSNIFGQVKLSPVEQMEVLDWIDENKDSMSRISFRTPIKVGGFRKHNPNEWQRLSRASTFQKGLKV
jgi:hypothetical protein